MRIFLMSYFDNNLGDDLMIRGILERYPKCKFMAISENESVMLTYQSYDNLEFINKKNSYSAISECDVYLTLGGSVFKYTSLRSVVGKMMKLFNIIKLKKKGLRIITIGSNLGPFTIPGSFQIAKAELKCNDFVTLRDEYSYNLVKDFMKDKVKFADDIVFELVDNVEVNKIRDGITVGISCYNPIENKEIKTQLLESYQIFIESFLNEYIDKNIVLFAFDTELENDLIIAEEIYKNSSFKDRIKIVAYEGDVSGFLEEYRKIDSILAVRFHSAILAEIYSIPFYPIAYSNKMENYIMDSYKTSTRSLNDFIEKPEEILKEFNNGLLSTESRTKIVSGHLKILDDFLINNNCGSINNRHLKD